MKRQIEIAKGARRRPGPFARIEDAVAAIAAGQMIIVVDDEDRENEGDLTIAAEKVSPEAINFMARHGRGLICLSMTPERLDELENRLWQRPDAKGLHEPDDIASQIAITSGAITGQWDPPSATQLEALRQTAEQLDKFLADFNRFCATDLAAFRKQVVEAKVGLLPEEAPIAVVP